MVKSVQKVAPFRPICAPYSVNPHDDAFGTRRLDERRCAGPPGAFGHKLSDEKIARSFAVGPTPKERSPAPEIMVSDPVIYTVPQALWANAWNSQENRSA
jgi:hypothetical protein